MSRTCITICDADGKVLSQEEIDVSDTPTELDLPDLADQVTQLNDAVQLLILTTLGT